MYSIYKIRFSNQSSGRRSKFFYILYTINRE